MKSQIDKNKTNPNTVLNILKVLQKKEITKDLLRDSLLGKTMTSVVTYYSSNSQTEDCIKVKA